MTAIPVLHAVPARVDEPARDVFPAVYGKLLPPAFDRPVPQEELATCSDCAMCAKGSKPALPGVGYFRPDAKCCTFQPDLPNYLVGAALADSDSSMAEGQRRLLGRIAARSGCRPTGIGATAVGNLLYENAASDAFGRSKALLCPYFVEGRNDCSIWKHRNSVCSTYFCKHVKGEDGRDFWMGAKAYVGHLEAVLASHIARQLGARPIKRTRDPAKLDQYALDGSVDEREYARAWGAWAGREAEFFRECHRIATRLERSDIVRIIGSFQDSTLEEAMLEAYDRMFAAPPEPLVRNPALALYPRPDGGLMARSDAGNFELSKELLDMLWGFDGQRTTAQANAFLQEHHGVSLSQGLVEQLYRNRILVAAERE